jgi:HTH DNA binding domain
MNRVTDTCRSSSKLGELLLSRLLVTVPLGARLLKVTPKAVDLMLAQLCGALAWEGSGQLRYRAWGIV